MAPVSAPRFAAALALGSAVALAVGAPARADVPDEAVVACDRRAAGDDCAGGTCVQSRCSRYRPNLGGGGGHAVEWDCLKCVAGPARSRAGLIVGTIVGAIALAGGVWLARRRGQPRGQPT